MTFVMTIVSDFKLENIWKLIVLLFSKYLFNNKSKFNFITELKFEFKHKNDNFKVIGSGNGPLDACVNALKASGFDVKFSHYEQSALDEEILGAGSTAMTVVHLEDENGKEVIGRARHSSTAVANIKAIFNALNIISKK